MTSSDRSDPAPAASDRRRCAIFQFEGVHEEIVPSLVLALNRAGYRPKLYINAQCEQERGDIFHHVAELDFELAYVPITARAHWNALAEEARRPEYEFICLSTFQHDGIVRWAEASGKPILGVIHNAKKFLQIESCQRVLHNGQGRFLTLASHVAVFLAQRIGVQYIDAVGVMEPVYWGIPPHRTEQPDNIRVVAIPGGVKFATRDYQKLADALADPDIQPRLNGLAFKVVGGGKDRLILEKEAVGRGLSGNLLFAPIGPSGRVLYDDYFAALKTADFLHPLAPLAFHPYREHKITSAVPTAIGFNLPMVLDRWTASAYRVPSLVADAPLAASVTRLIDTDAEEAAAQRTALARYRQNALDSGAAEVQRLLQQLG